MLSHSMLEILRGKPARFAVSAAPIFILTIVLQTGVARAEDFHGLPCYDGCGSLKEGYYWAQENNAHDPYACSGHGAEFEKGCSMYVYEAGPAPPPPPPKNSDGQDRDSGSSDNGSSDSGSSDPPR